MMQGRERRYKNQPQRAQSSQRDGIKSLCPSVFSVVFYLMRPIFCIQRRIRKVQPVARHHDSIGIDVHTNGAPSQELALHQSFLKNKMQYFGKKTADER